MAIVDQEKFANALKIRQARRQHDLEQMPSKLLVWMPKSYTFTGNSKENVVNIAPNAGGGNTFAGALLNQGYQRKLKFIIVRGRLYSIGEIDHETILASADQKGAVVKALDDSLDKANDGFLLRLSIQLWGDQGGARARVATGGVAGNVVTLTDPRDTVKFEVGTTIVAAATDGLTGSPYNGQTFVEKVSNADGTITLDDASAINPGTGIAAGDYIFGYDEFGNSLYGVKAWIPPTNAGLSTPFLNVDRSVHEVRLAGYREVRTEDIESALISFVGNARQYGAMFDSLWLNSVRFTEVQKSLNAAKDVTVNIKDSSGRVVISYDTIGIRCGGKIVPIMDDPWVPYRSCYGLTRDSWELCGLGQIPHFADDDGRKLLRSPNSDASQYRLRAFLQPVCWKPHKNGHLDLGD